MANSIDYRFSCTPKAVFDGQTVPYFKSKGFNTADLVVYDQTNPKAAFDALKAQGFKVIVDIEQPIWAGGQTLTPIGNFGGFFSMLKSIGVEYVCSEGGRDGDLDFMANYFKGYVNYNCDQCGLWKGFYKHPFTAMNSWESYYTWEWPSIQKGIQESSGKKQGLLMGVWEGGVNPIFSSTKSGSGLNIYDMMKWVMANGGLDHLEVWGGLNDGMMWNYKALGFENVIANAQSIFPANPIGGSTPTPVLPVTPSINSNPIAKIDGVTFQYQVNSFVKIQGSAKDAAGNGTSRPVGLWENIKGTMVGQKWTKSNAAFDGYFDFVVSDLASGNHFFQLWTDDNYAYTNLNAFNLRR